MTKESNGTQPLRLEERDGDPYDDDADTLEDLEGYPRSPPPSWRSDPRSYLTSLVSNRRRRFILFAGLFGLSLLLASGVFWHKTRSRGSENGRAGNDIKHDDEPPKPERLLPCNLTSPSSPLEKPFDNLHMTYDQCESSFPLLYSEIDRSVRYYSRPGKRITAQDLDRIEREHDPGDSSSGARVAIIDNRLYIKYFHKGWQSRVLAIIQSLYQALLSSPEPIPDVEFGIGANDVPSPGGPARWELARPLWESDEDAGHIWLLPDFGFFSWPELVNDVGGFNEARCRAREVDERVGGWDNKVGKLFWRGTGLSPLRLELVDLTTNRSWADVRPTDPEHLRPGERVDRVPIHDHCKYKFLAQTEGGWGYSGRLKYLLNCKSVIIAHELGWVQTFHPVFNSDPSSPDQNIVIVKGPGWSGLTDEMEALLGDDERARRIAENSYKTFRQRYLTPGSVACYWRRALREYANIQAFTPTRGQGIDFESFILSVGPDTIVWPPKSPYRS